MLPKEKIGVFLVNQENIFEVDEEKVNEAFANQENLMGEVRQVHSVKYGETLGGIAARYRCKVSDLQDWNGIRGNLITEGQRLVVYGRKSVSSSGSVSVSGDEYHTIRKGDTLWGISKQTGVPVSQILKLNNMSGNTPLKIGTRLKLG